MVKHTQTIRRLLPTNSLSVFDHFVRLALKELTNNIGSHPIDLLKMPHLRPSLFKVSKETSLSKNKKK